MKASDINRVTLLIADRNMTASAISMLQSNEPLTVMVGKLQLKLTTNVQRGLRQRILNDLDQMYEQQSQELIDLGVTLEG